MSELEKLIHEIKTVTKEHGYDAGVSILWSKTIDGLGENAFHELLDAIVATNAEVKLGSRQGFRLRHKSSGLFVKQLSYFSRSKHGKTWATEGHLKSAMTTAFGAPGEKVNNSSCYRNANDLKDYEILNIATGAVTDAYALWWRRPKS